MYYNDYLYHHGILGMKWGVRRTPEQLGHLSKSDRKWVRKNSDKVTKKTTKMVAKELSSYDKTILNNPNSYNKSGKLSAAAINAHNKKMAELMNKKVSDLSLPSGKVVKFVAKRGDVGVMMAVADQGYNMNQIKNGVYTSGKVAYKSTVLDKV